MLTCLIEPIDYICGYAHSFAGVLYTFSFLSFFLYILLSLYVLYLCLSHNHCDLQPWARAVCTLPAVPRSTQPSTLRGMVNECQLSD